MSKNWIKERERRKGSNKLKNLMACLSSGEQIRLDDVIHSSKSPTAKDYSRSVQSSEADELEHKVDVANIEEAESSIREGGSLDYEEARSLLGRYEYQKGNIEAALHVFEGIDIAAITPKLKITLGGKGDFKRRSHSFAALPMSVHKVGLLLESILLKAKSLQVLGRYKEAAQSCTVILDIVESSLPAGLPENFAADYKLQETLNNSVELLPELWKLVDSPREAIFSYRRALLHNWNLDSETIAKIQKEFAIYLLYSGGDAIPPNLRFQMDSSFVPKNNMEEAILLLMILLRKISMKKIEWDPTIMDHLSYALSICGGLSALATELAELLPGIIKRKDRYHTFALCYYGEGDDMGALNLWRKLLNNREDPTNIQALLMASRICGERSSYVEGTNYALRALENVKGGRCSSLAGVANSLLGISLAAHSRSVVTDSERAKIQFESLQSLETAGRMTKLSDPRIIYHLSLENAGQRKLDAALYYVKWLLKVEGGSIISSWILMARILSAMKRFQDAETVINAALDQTGKWDQGELLRTKAKLQVAQGQLKNAVKTYTELLAVLQVHSNSFGSETNLLEDEVSWHKSLETETWHDLAFVYTSLSQWRDAELCLSKSKAIRKYSASRWHATGMLYEAKGLHKEALGAFEIALDEDPKHVPSLVSMAAVLRQISGQSPPVVRSFLTEALRLDRMNSSAWYNLGMLYKDKGAALALEAAECFEAATLLEETAPVEPFR